MNSYNCIGRVGKDAVTRQAGDNTVTGWSLAVDSGYGAKKQTLWLDCSGWGKRFEAVGDYIKKGAQLGVTGELGTREHDGRTYLTLKVAEVSLVGGKRDGDGEQRAGGSGGSRGGAPQRQRTHSSKQAPVDDFSDDIDKIPFATNRCDW